MELRNFEIAFYSVEWCIALCKYSSRRHDDGIGIEGLDIFYTLKTKDGKVNYILEYFGVEEEDIKQVEPYEAFHELCNFTHFDPCTGKIIKTFTGTLIDALRYVKDTFKDTFITTNDCCCDS